MILTEEFKRNYENFYNTHILEECVIVSKEIELEQAKLNRSLDVMVSTSRLMESVLHEDDETIEGILNKIQGLVKDNNKNLPKTNPDAINIIQYEPVAIAKRTDITDLKPIARIKFLFERIIDWIKRIVLFAINKIRGIFYMIVGRKDDASKMLEKTSAADLKFRLSKLEKISNTVIKNIYSGSGDLKKASAVQIKELPLEDVIKAGQIFKPLAENVEYLSEDEKEKEKKDKEKGTAPEDELKRLQKEKNRTPYNGKRTEVRVLELDTSQDLYALQQTLHHFFDLFDNAFGSQGENLFSPNDLQLVFKYIEQVYKLIVAGKSNPVLLQMQSENISSDVIYDNLLRTKQNVDNLGKAYYDTYVQIDKINKIITNKQLLSLTQFGVNYMYLSQYTYNAMIDVLKYTDERLKHTAGIQKELEKTKKDFEELTNKLGKLRDSTRGFGLMQVSSIYEQKINDLFASTKYMTQITSLRLNCLMKYIQELQSVRITIANLNALSNQQRQNLTFNYSF